MTHSPLLCQGIVFQTSQMGPVSTEVPTDCLFVSLLPLWTRSTYAFSGDYVCIHCIAIKTVCRNWFTQQELEDKPFIILLELAILFVNMDFPSGSDRKESACNVGDPGEIPGSGRSPGEGNSYPPQYSCLENPMDRGAWRATVLRVTKSQTQLRD